MRISKHRLLVGATAAAAAVALAVPAAAQASPAVATATATGKVTSKHVIVLLKNQHTALAPKRGVSTARARAFAADQAGVVGAAQRMGATKIGRFNLINGFAATIGSNKLAALASNPKVAAVVPDLRIKAAPLPHPDAGAGTIRPNLNNIPQSSLCSTDAAHPRLEPEALQTMKVAFDNPNTPSASKLGFDGSGVTVGWIADGVDPNNPDFVRANGDHVLTDYQDFSGDGLDAVTLGGEAFGDASAIGATGVTVHNIAEYAAAAHPTGDCFIRIRGVAPGVNMVGLKAFGNSNSAPTSNILFAIQYAVNVDHVDVLNESFGSNPFPDNMDDPISLANDAAIDAGVTVVSSTGDAGTTNTIGSPASSPRVIAAAGTTTFRSVAQLKEDGLSNQNGDITFNGFADDNISSLSSGGYASNGKVPDVSAPGDLGWALCSPDAAQFTDCTGEDGQSPVNEEEFGGTSMSSPLTAGAAALVIQAYEQGHDGARPTPAVVKSIITSTAQDLGHPAFEQGAGEVDALAAVQAALSMPAPGSSTVPASATGAGLVTSTSKAGLNQLNLSGQPGRTVTGRFTLRNASPARQTVSLSTRSLTKRLSRATTTITLDPAHTFPNVTGAARAYQVVPFNVPVGADRLDASFAVNSGPFAVFEALVDPFGTFQAYNIPQGVANFGHVDARNPAPGTWHAMVWANPAMTNPIQLEFTTSKYTSFGAVSPTRVTLAPGAATTVTASFPTGRVSGDQSAAVVMRTGLGTQADLPVSLRTLVPTSKATNTFRGVLTGGNGRQFDAQMFTYFLDVPRGKPGLAIKVLLNRPQNPNEILFGFLEGPDGMTQSARSNIIVNGAGQLDFGRSVTTFVRHPGAGRWRFILELTTPSGGEVINQPFTGIAQFKSQAITAKLPTSATKLTRGQTKRFTVTVTNNTGQQQLYFADPRLNTQTTYNLASQVPGNDLQNLPLPDTGVTPQWLVPTNTTNLSVFANATLPVGLDVNWQFGDPEVFGPPQGNAASVSINSPHVNNGPWFGGIGEQGPFDGPAPAGTASANAQATTSTFDLDADSSTGDFWLTSLIPAPPPEPGVATRPTVGKRSLLAQELRAQALHTPVRSVTPKAAPPACDPNLPILAPGASCTITFTITPSAARGTVVRGHLNVETLDLFGGTTTQRVSLPYAYTVK
jgi:subtilisin family serine protease